MTINAAGGSPRTICSLVDDVPRGGTWGSAGDIVFSSGNSPRLYRVSDQGGAPVPLATDETLTREAFWPRFLPDGHTLLYWAREGGAGAGVYASSIAEGARTKKVLTNRTAAVYDPAGFLLFTSGSSLLRQRFDPTRLEVSGETRPVVEGVATNTAIGLAAFSVSANGVLVFEPEEDLSSQLAWFDRAGRMLETVGDPGKYRYPALSPDGSRLAYTNLADGNLWIFDMSRRIASKFTTGAGVKVAPVWSPDGGAIFYRKMSGDGAPSGFYEKSASGGVLEKLFFKGSLNGPQQISPDGKWLLYFANSEGESVQDIYVLPMTGDRKPQRIVQSPFADVEPQFSPDGRFIAYASGATGRNEVYVQPFPATGEQFRVSDSGGRQPLWRKDGKELFFVSDDRKFYAVEIRPGPRFDYGRPQFLFEMRANVFNTRNSYIPSVDGQRFLVNMALIRRHRQSTWSGTGRRG
jgi:Tol biopolymer transport system component